MRTSTSWQNVGQWYNQTVGLDGNYYHQHTVIPGVLRLLNLESKSSLLDLACGQGILERQVPKEVYYLGIDLAPALIDFAKKHARSTNHLFLVNDITKPLALSKKDFTHATILLALQNIEFPEEVIKNCQKYLDLNGKLAIVLNHPCFRVPRQSSWEIDQKNKIEYRRLNRYLTPLKIPITTNYGNNKRITWSFHQPLSFYSQILFQHGFIINKIEEWISDKQSAGQAAKMENRRRQEFPLFLAILAQKFKN